MSYIAPIKDADQSVRMHRLIRVLDGRTCQLAPLSGHHYRDHFLSCTVSIHYCAILKELSQSNLSNWLQSVKGNGSLLEIYSQVSLNPGCSATDFEC